MPLQGYRCLCDLVGGDRSDEDLKISTLNNMDNTNEIQIPTQAHPTMPPNYS